MAKIFPAATVVLIRDSDKGLETLLLRRAKELSFGGGSWVFPGGRIDREDYGTDLDNIEAAARQGAVRETREEAGLAINHSDLLYFAHWTTPPEMPKRFATWFFISELINGGDNVQVDGSEIVAHQWYTPAAALRDRADKTIAMMPPTFVTLTELNSCNSVAEVMLMYQNRPVQEFLPHTTVTDRGIAMLYPGDAGYENNDQTADGDRHRFWMLDEAWRYEKTGGIELE